MNRVVFLLFGLVAISVLCSSGRLFACASCGSSGDDVLLMYPNERWKFVSGVNSQAGFRNLGPDGESYSAGGIERRQFVNVAVGRNLRSDLLFGVTFGLQSNSSDQRREQGLTDPGIALRWTMLAPNILRPEFPQIQFLAGHRYPIGSSIQDTKDPELLDVTSSGYQESRMGLDHWWGQQSFKGGFALMWHRPWPRRFDGRENAIAPGSTLRTAGTLAFSFNPQYKITGGIVREQRWQNDSYAELRQYNSFFNFDYSFDAMRVIRLSFSKNALPGWDNRNGARFDSVGLSYQHAI